MPRANPARALRTRAARLAALLGAALLLGACAAGPGASDAAGDAEAAPTPSATGAVGDAAAPDAFDVRVECADDDLRALVERFNTLQRYRAVRDLEDGELARLMVLAERDVRDLLGTEGYFSPTVQVRREGAADARPTVVITIEPGEPTTVAHVDIGFAGDIAQSADAGARRQREAIEDGWTLKAGRRFTQQRWSAAKTEALRQLVARRYPRGRIESSRADIDAAQARARLSLQLDSGPLFRLGPSIVKGAERYPPWLAERLSWLKPGDEYDQKELVDAQQRLTGSGYYDAAYISIDPEGDPAAAPVTYTVTEAKRHKLQLGVGYSRLPRRRASRPGRARPGWIEGPQPGGGARGPLLQRLWGDRRFPAT